MIDKEVLKKARLPEKSLIVRLELELWKAVKHYTVDNTTSVAQVLRDALMAYLDKRKK